MELLDTIAGHAWTVLPSLRNMVAPRRMPPSVAWSTTIEDPVAGPVLIRGKYRERDSDTLVIIVHGLGGTPDSGYLEPIATAAEQRGWSSLRLALRGSEGIGNDFYHAGLTEDPKIAIADPAFADYDRIFVVGFSLGGHITLCLTTEELDPRVRAVAAVCPPVDLSAGARALDEPASTVYREYILRALRDLYRGVSQTADVPTPYDRVRQVHSLREWDALTVVPRFGFADVEDYYYTAGIARRIEQIARPTLMVHSHHDPLVPPRVVAPVLSRAPDLFEPHWFDGAGHVFFPPGVDLGEPAEARLGPQVIAWLDRHT